MSLPAWRHRCVREQVGLAHRHAPVEQRRRALGLAEHGGRQHALEGAAHREALVLAMADAAAAGGVQQGHAQAAGAGLFQRGEISGGGDGGIGGCVAVVARRTCQQRQGSEEATAAPLNCRNRRRASIGVLLVTARLLAPPGGDQRKNQQAIS
jgi:hypothetical protein